MAYLLHLAVCKTGSCGCEILIPFSIPVRTTPYRGPLTTDADYLDLACPQCGHVYRYFQDELRSLLYDTDNPYQAHSGKAWIGVWLGCDDENCSSHALVETIVASGISKSELKKRLESWTLHGIACYSGHPAKFPPEWKWDSIPD